jgi:hypothetical protein
MTPAQKILSKLGLKDSEPIETKHSNTDNIPENPRRDFLKKSALGGITLGGAFLFSPY